MRFAGGGGLDGAFAEPTWLRVSPFELYPQPTNRFVHFSDLHYKGDAEICGGSGRRINSLAPEFVCFTGDLVEEARFAPAALDFIRQIQRPVYGCPGNWDYASGADFTEYEKAFAEPAAPGWRIATAFWKSPGSELIGMGLRGVHALGEPQAVRRDSPHSLSDPSRPARWTALRFDHRRAFAWRSGALPFYGAIVLTGVGRYDLGRFDR